jgi:hypothetical protein
MKMNETVRQYIPIILMVGLILAGGCSAPLITHIESRPPGARVEINEDTVGVTPIDVTLAQTDNHKLKGRTVIRIIPSVPGQPAQEKVLFNRQYIPVNVVFEPLPTTETNNPAKENSP